MPEMRRVCCQSLFCCHLIPTLTWVRSSGCSTNIPTIDLLAVTTPQIFQPETPAAKPPLPQEKNPPAHNAMVSS
ncbi:uncharacterized protein K444DRAFT_121770 [Hyaloscypha bicolor E]|uniref:Uncharacterized protein n=1 Tax=Hyaloscypha bicolor E TaxID=1095630 RepID=A0A2J6TUC5_9HELO|nr:uncharacterized protein K444DRAFT_121770 [Hyaloscypha bicolor E]PMD66601.1 hypothetical protein K444DRAFT_121770 [Hyaloscypha bicolor E]